MELRLVAAHRSWCLPRKEEEGNKSPFASSPCSTVPWVHTKGRVHGCCCLHRGSLGHSLWGTVRVFGGVCAPEPPSGCCQEVPEHPWVRMPLGLGTQWMRAAGRTPGWLCAGQGAHRHGSLYLQQDPFHLDTLSLGSCHTPAPQDLPCSVLTPASHCSSYISQSISPVLHNTKGREWEQTLLGMSSAAKEDVEEQTPRMERKASRDAGAAPGSCPPHT